MLPIQVNEHVISIVLKELVRRAMVAIRNKRLTFEVMAKAGYTGSMDDVFTTADEKAQEIFEKSIRETFPGVGIIGEEGLRVPCTIHGVDAYITIDPLDGTKAFIRRQSHGVATMVAFVLNGEIISAWIGDVNTLEIYGYRPNSKIVHRISQLEVSQKLNDVDRKVPIDQGYVLLRSYHKSQDDMVARTIQRFKEAHIYGSSIGIWYAKLWIGEYVGLLLDGGGETPWDSTPVIGISQKLGFVFMRPKGDAWEKFEPALPKMYSPRDHHMLVVHSSVAKQFLRA